jgi:hypothetical protein
MQLICEYAARTVQKRELVLRTGSDYVKCLNTKDAYKK